MSSAGLGVAQRRGTSALAGREVRRVVSLWTQTILPPVLTTILFLAIFGGALGERIREIEGVAYGEFILPGLLVMTVASQTFANNSTSLFQAKSEGYIEDVLTSPLGRGRSRSPIWRAGSSEASQPRSPSSRSPSPSPAASSDPWSCLSRSR